MLQRTRTRSLKKPERKLRKLCPLVHSVVLKLFREAFMRMLSMVSSLLPEASMRMMLSCPCAPADEGSFVVEAEDEDADAMPAGALCPAGVVSRGIREDAFNGEVAVSRDINKGDTLMSMCPAASEAYYVEEAEEAVVETVSADIFGSFGPFPRGIREGDTLMWRCDGGHWRKIFDDR